MFLCDTVPSAVTHFQVHPLPPYALQVSWALPEFPNGVITGFEITVYNNVFGYNISVSTAPDIYRVNISEIIGNNYSVTNPQCRFELFKCLYLFVEPFIPYTVEIKAFTHVGGSVTETVIAFSQEGGMKGGFKLNVPQADFVFSIVPKRSPTMTEVHRTNAMTALLKWEPLTLEELGGFLNNYTVKYNWQDARACPASPPGTSETLFNKEDSARITNMDPSLEYCVYIAASTVAGVGSYSQGRIPCKTAPLGIGLMYCL